MLKIYKYGTPIVFIDGEIKGTIIGVIIRNNHIQYEIGYFLNNIHYTTWRDEFEFKTEKIKKIEIGFKGLA